MARLGAELAKRHRNAEEDLKKARNQILDTNMQVSTAVGKSDPIPKVQKPPILHGKESENIELWLNNFELLLRLNRADKAEWADIASLFLREGAADCGEAERCILTKSQPADWAAFCTVMLKYFGTRNPEHKARSDLDFVRFTGNIEKYTQTVSMLSTPRSALIPWPCATRFPCNCRASRGTMNCTRWSRLTPSAACHGQT